MKLPESLRKFLNGGEPIKRPPLRRHKRRRPCGGGAPHDSFTRMRAADYIKTSVPTMHRLEKLGRLVPHRSGVGHPFYLKSQLDEFLRLNGEEVPR